MRARAQCSMAAVSVITDDQCSTGQVSVGLGRTGPGGCVAPGAFDCTADVAPVCGCNDRS